MSITPFIIRAMTHDKIMCYTIDCYRGTNDPCVFVKCATLTKSSVVRGVSLNRLMSRINPAILKTRLDGVEVADGHKQIRVILPGRKRFNVPSIQNVYCTMLPSMVTSLSATIRSLLSRSSACICTVSNVISCWDSLGIRFGNMCNPIQVVLSKYGGSL